MIAKKYEKTKKVLMLPVRIIRMVVDEFLTVKSQVIRLIVSIDEGLLYV